MAIIFMLANRPYDGAKLSIPHAEAVSKLVPATPPQVPPMPQGHTTGRIAPDAVRPWVNECVSRLGGVAVPGGYILDDRHKAFVDTLEKSLVEWGGVSIFRGIPAKCVEAPVAQARLYALATLVADADSAAELLAGLAKLGATPEEAKIAKAEWKKAQDALLDGAA